MKYMAMKKQMELFEPVEGAFDEGGLMQEGGTVDPESGNEVPVGSTQEEVRDDIPAQLSEGEFVFPADVVRYIGLEKLMQMRQEAKRGLEMMDKMGQMGNSDEAVIPDDVPFDMSDLDMEDDGMLEFQTGGFVQQPTGFIQQPVFTGIQGYQPSQFATAPTGYIPYTAPTIGQPVAQTYTPPQQQAVPMLGEQTPGSFTDFMGVAAPSPGGYDELRTYVNDAGQEMQIPFKDGNPLYPIPEGFKPKGKAADTTQTTTTTGSGVSSTVQSDSGDGPEYTRMSDFERERREIQSSDAFKSMYDDVDTRGTLTKAKDFGQDLYKSVLGGRDEERAGFERLAEDLTDYLQQFPADQRERAAQEFKAAFAEGKQGRTDGTLAEVVDRTTPEARARIKEMGILTTSPDQVRDVTIESATVLGANKGVQEYAKQNNIPVEQVRELMKTDPKLAQGIQQLGELKKEGAEVEQDTVVKRPEAKAATVETRNFSPQERLVQSGSISRQRREDPNYNPYDDNETVHKSEVYNPATGRTETINYNTNGIGRNSRGQNVFASGYLTTDKKGRVVSSAIPGSQEYKDRRNTRVEAQKAGIDTKGKTTGQIRQELQAKRDADAKKAAEAARISRTTRTTSTSSDSDSDSGYSGVSYDTLTGTESFEDYVGRDYFDDEVFAKGGLAQQMKQSGLASKK